MWLSMVLTCLCLWLTPAESDHHETEHEPRGALIIPAMLYYPSWDTLCIHGLHMKSVTQLTVTIKSLNETQTLYPDPPVNNSVYQCMPFQVPAPAYSYQEVINITMKATTYELREVFFTETKALVNLQPQPNLTFVQTDQNTYKPGQEVRCRIVKMDQNYKVFKDPIPLVTLQGPYYWTQNEIVNWTLVCAEHGIAEIIYQLDPDSPTGTYYFITDSTYKYFYVDDFVLPEIDVIFTSPGTIFFQDQSFTIQVCGRNLHKQPAQGTVMFKACQYYYNYYYYLPTNQDSLCYESSAHTDSSGCLTAVIQTDHFKLTNNSYSRSIIIQASFAEDKTGAVINATSQYMYISQQASTLEFKEMKSNYQQGIPYTGKVVLKDTKGNPLPYENVTISYIDPTSYNTREVSCITDADGEASLYFDTKEWSGDYVSLQARHNPQASTQPPGEVGPYYGTAYSSARRLYSYTNSTITIRREQGTAPCGQVLKAYVDYTMSSEDMKYATQSITFYYVVLSKDGLIENGRISQLVQASYPQGSFLISLCTDKMSPFAWLVVYMINSDGGVAADSTSLSVSSCLSQKVSLTFLEDQVLAGTDATLKLEADPYDLCALRAVDETALPLLYQLTNDVPVSYYNRWFPYEARDPDPCVNMPIPTPTPNWDTTTTAPMYYRWEYGTPYRTDRYDIKTIFRDAGFQIPSNLLTEAPLECYYPKYLTYDYGAGTSTYPVWMMTELPTTQTTTVASTTAEETTTTMVTSTTTTTTQTTQTTTVMTTPTMEKPKRMLFTETWLWDKFTLDCSGIMEMNVTTPDTIRNWRAMAFCVGDGLKVSEIANLTTI